MSELRTCPSCGAQSSASVCEYCGTKIPIKVASIENLIGERIGVNTDLRYDVIPFTATKEQARSAMHKKLGNIQNGIIYETSELGYKIKGLSVKITKSLAVYVPYSPLKNADKIKSLKCVGSIKELPQGFPSSLSGNLWEKMASSVIGKSDKNRELNRASILIPPKEATENADRFITVGDITYLPFWVIEGTIASKPFNAFIFAGGKEQPEVININIEGGNVKDLLRATNKDIYPDYEKALKARSEAHKKKVARDNKRRKASSVIIWIFILFGAVAGLWFGSFMHLYTDAVGAILLGGLLALVGGGIGFLISMIFCKID